MLRSHAPEAAEVETGSRACPAWPAHVRAARCKAGQVATAAGTPPLSPTQSGWGPPEARRTAQLCSCEPGPLQAYLVASRLLTTVGRTGPASQAAVGTGILAGPFVATAAAAPGASSTLTLASTRGIAKPCWGPQLGRWSIPARLWGPGGRVGRICVAVVPAPPNTALKGPPALTSQQT